MTRLETAELHEGKTCERQISSKPAITVLAAMQYGSRAVTSLSVLEAALVMQPTALAPGALHRCNAADESLGTCRSVGLGALSEGLLPVHCVGKHVSVGVAFALKSSTSEPEVIIGADAERVRLDFGPHRRFMMVSCDCIFMRVAHSATCFLSLCLRCHRMVTIM